MTKQSVAGVRRLGPFTILFAGALFVLAPYGWSLYASFVPNDLDLGHLDTGIFGLRNYSTLLTDPNTGRWLLNSVIVTGCVVIANVILNSAAGYALARLRFPGRSVVRTIIIIAMVVPPQVLFVPLYIQVVQLGWLNTYAGLIVPFLVNPFGVFLMCQFMVSIPREIEEAAVVDGVGHIRLFFQIAAPLSWPAASAQAIILFVWNWNTFAFPSVLATSGEMYTLPVGLFQLTHSTFTNSVALSMAGVILTTIPTLIVYGVFQRRFMESLAGATKG